MAIHTLLSKLKELGVQLSLQQGQLRVEAPKDVVSESLLAEIRQHRDSLIGMLGQWTQPDTLRIRSAPSGEFAAVSPAQQRMWLICRDKAASSAYHISSLFSIQGSLDENILRDTFKILIDRHESLRTTFHWDEENGVMQKVHPSDKFPFILEILHIPAEDIPTAAEDLIRNRISQPFDLENGPLLRVCLLYNGDRQAYITFSMHHLISDGWSMNILAGQLVLVYNSLSNGTQGSLPPSLHAYKDFAFTLQEYIRGQGSTTARNFWKQQLAAPLPELNMPCKGTRPPLKTFNGETLSFTLAGDIIMPFREYLREEGTTLFNGLLTVINILLFRYTGQTDIILGTPQSGRQIPAIEHEIGCYVNTLPIRCLFSPSDSFQSLLQRIIQKWYDVMEHALYPFDALMEELKIQRNPSRSPIFDAWVVLQEQQVTGHVNELFLGNALLTNDRITGDGISKFDISFSFEDTGAGLLLDIGYNTALFERDFMMTIGTHFTHIIMDVTRHPSIGIQKLPLLSAPELERLVYRLNATRAPFPEEETLVSLFEQQVRSNPAAIAVCFGSVSMTRQEIDTYANRIAGLLTNKYHIRKEEPVALCMDRSPRMIFTIMGVLKAGAFYVPIDPDLPSVRIKYMLADCGTRILLTDTDLDNDLQASYTDSIVDLRHTDWMEEEFSAPEPGPAPHNLAYLIYTSGSSGKPKGVQLEHSSIVNRIHWMFRHYSFTSSDVILQKTAYTFDVSVWEIFLPLCFGCRLILCDKTTSRDPGLITALCKNAGVTTLHFVPGMFTAFLSYLQPIHLQQLIGLRHIFASGEALLPHTVRMHYDKIGIPLHNLYGPTEAAVDVTFYETQPDDTRVPLGAPIDNTRIYILDESLNMVPQGVFGEIAIGGVGVARGYCNNKELTTRKFLPDPFLLGDERIYLSGDMGRWTMDGQIEYAGRKDDQVKIRGFRIETGEVENALLEHPDVDSVVVMALRDEEGPRCLAAWFCSPRPETETQVLQDWLSRQLPEYMIPAFFIRMDTLPLNASGKVDKTALPQPDLSGNGKPSSHRPSTPVEIELAPLWQEVLRRETSSIEDDFFISGGDSIRVIRLIGKINRKWDISLEVKDVFLNSTLRSLAALIERTGKTEDTCREKAMAEMEELYGNITTTPELVSLLPPDWEDVYPVSDIQKGIIYYNIVGGEHALYQDQFFYQFEDDRFDWGRLQRAIGLLVEQHPMLRTSFHLTLFRQPVQVVRRFDPGHTYGYFEDISSFSDDRQRLHLDQYAAGLRKKELDVRTTDTWNIHVFQLNKTAYGILLVFHHALMDGWSVASFITQLGHTYFTLAGDTAFRPALLPVTYKDYLLDQLAVKHQKETPAWWKELLKDYTHPRLPLGKEAGMTFGHKKQHRHLLDATLIEKLNTFAGQQQLPIKDIFMAALGLILQLTTGEVDLLWGVVTHGRPAIEGSDKVLGCFLNTIPFRLRLHLDWTIAEYCHHIHQLVIDAKPHERLSLAGIVQAMGQPFSRTNPFFDVLFNFVDFHIYEEGNASIRTVDPIMDNYEVNNALMDFQINRLTDGLSVSINYHAALYEEAEIVRLTAWFTNILSHLCDGPSSKPLHEIPCLTTEEIECQKSLLNNTGIRIPDGFVHELFSEQALRHPSQMILVRHGESFTNEFLDSRSDKLAILFSLEYKVRKGDVIAVMADRSEYLIIAMFAIWKAGAVYLPIDATLPDERKRYIFSDAAPVLLITDMQTQSGHDIPLLKIDSLEHRWASIPAGSPWVSLQHSDIAYIIYTSGSTGNPKGVIVSHGNFTNFLAAMNQELPMNRDNHLLAVTTVSFDISLLELVWTLCNGIPITLKTHTKELTGFDRYLSGGSGGMDFSLFFFSSSPAYAQNSHYNLLFEAAKFGDAHGFSAVWTPERHFHEFGGPYANPAVTSAALSQCTHNITIRSGSIVLPIHDTIRVAEEWSMVDNFSKGRVELSIATGWHVDDYVFFPERYAQRREWMAQQCEELRHLWKGGSVTRKNGAGIDISVKIYPAPVQPEIPIWVTAAGNPDTFRSAGRLGANILTHMLGQDIGVLKANIALYKNTLAENGFSPSKAKIAVMLHTYLGEDIDQIREEVEAPFKSYLRSSVNLLQNLGKSFNVTFRSSNTEDAAEQIIDLSFKRYWQKNSLIGTIDSCERQVQDLLEIGVTEVACLIDFGVREDLVLGSLHLLQQLKDRTRAQPQKSPARPEIDSIQLTPSFLKLLLADKGSHRFLASLKNIVIGGEPLSPALVEETGKYTTASLYNAYGPTETTIWSTIKALTPREEVTAGKPVANTQVYILDAFGRKMPPGIEGEICIAGKGVSAGYLHQQELTNARFIPDTTAGKEEKMYRTGDIGTWNQQGEVIVKGRNDRQIKLNGYRIELPEIEKKMMELPGIVEAVVVVAGEERDKFLAAAYTTAGPGKEPLLRDKLRQFLPEYMIPRKMTRLEKLPMTIGGKIDMPHLKKLLTDNREESQTERPIAFTLTPPSTASSDPTGSTDLLEEVRQMWSAVFEREDIGLGDNFFTIGGNSMLVLRLFDLMETRFPRVMRIAHLFDNATISAQTSFLQQNLPALKEKTKQQQFDLLEL